MICVMINIKAKSRALKKMPETWVCGKTIEVLVRRASGEMRGKYIEKLQRKRYQKI